MRKLEVFHSLLVSKLVYGLSAVWLGLAEQRRVDAFQNYCLRRILRIPPGYVSRIRNVENCPVAVILLHLLTAESVLHEV